MKKLWLSLQVFLLFEIAFIRTTSTFSINNATELKNNHLFINYCSEKIVNIMKLPLLSTNCCLTKLCSNSVVLEQMIRDHPVIKRLYFQLCSENFYLARELLSGCVLDDKLNMKINKDKNNQHEQISNKEHDRRGEISTIKTKIEEINSRIIDIASKKKSTGTKLEATETDSPHTRYNKKKLENITKPSARMSGLQFLDVPFGDEMHIQDLKFNEEYKLFELFSFLIGYLQPTQFPLDILRQSIQNHWPVHATIIQIIRDEWILIGWIIFWTILTVCIPCVLCAYHCCHKKHNRLDEVSSEISNDDRGKCSNSTLSANIHILLLLLMLPIILIIIANEQISRQISRSSEITDVVFNDLNTFVRNTHLQLTFVATSSTDITIEAVRNDLEDVEGLLGRPFREELATETGINIALENLDGVKYATSEVAMLVSNLMDECLSAHTAGSLLQEQLKEIAAQLTIARQHCLPKDRALCYTLQYSGLDVSFSCDNLTSDIKIKHLERMGKERVFNTSVKNAKDTFERIPQHVSGKAALHVSEMKTILNRKRTEVYKSTHSLDEFMRSLTHSISSTHQTVSKVTETISQWDLWRWSIILGICSMLILLWCFLICGTSCGGKLTSRRAVLLAIGINLSSLTCFAIWSLGTTSLILGSHSNAFVCRPLYDRPHYKTLGELFDFDGVLYGGDENGKSGGSRGGLFKAFIKGNSTLRLRDVLKGCERNHPAYCTFNLHNYFDIHSLTDYNYWDDFRSIIANFSIENIPMEILSPSLQLNLQFLSTLSASNFTKYRLDMSASITKRDLNSFADQLNTVARQMNDLVGSRRIENLAINVRKIIKEDFKRLKDFKDSILYKITALEVLLFPLSKQANQSLSHLKTIQYYLDNQGWKTAQKSSQRFTSKIENYLANLQDHIVTKITKDIGRCKPLWDIFHSIRFCICELIIDPINGISVCCFLLIVLFLAISPMALKLVERYKDINEEILTTISHRRTRDGLIIDNEGTWASPPSSENPPEMEMHNVRTDETWNVPGIRQSSEPLIPPPPRPLSELSSRITSPKSSNSRSRSKLRSPKRLSTIASRITAARVPQIPSVSRARSPKRGRHESLRLIEPICWKTSGSLSPRSWI